MRCPTCQLPFASDAPGQICPRCALSGALALTTTAPANADQLSRDYDLQHEIGRGAMGVVWLARDRTLDRLVAVKVIHDGGNPLLAQRLLREGQAAARLRHPHIVTVHAMVGNGTSTFLVMDYLEGGNLEELLTEKTLPAPTIADITAKLANALAHAHASGLLHRDVKPSNILLDADGSPQLGDFGLAAPVEGAGELTLPGHIAGTPAYLAPELLAGAEHASPASDVYGLGSVLYRCLTGRAPFVGSSAAAILTQLREAEPIAPRLLQPEVPRDLETICLKCLQKSPAQRYESAAALEADLRRFLAGEPIRARPVSRAEKIVRWANRHHAATAAIGLAAVVLFLLAVGGPLVAVRLDRSRRAAEAARAQAADEAAISQEVVEFLQNDLLAQASPDHEPDRDLKLRAVLDRAARKIEGRFADQPRVEAAIRGTLGQTYESLGEYAAAQHHLERALQLDRQHLGPEDPETLGVMSGL
ncbi:MAG TPA: protein kinase, partial [Candidatus Didemnitutus sp.]|nr:protein kinase [Candidatus Didemnitutus sp.]